ncbi:hypothetical protein EON83_25605 [bacterium]|nr:MAG: hypothetical protein EON83_25605 [bacterium]
MKSLARLREIQNKNSNIVNTVKSTNFESRKETPTHGFSTRVGIGEPTKLTKPFGNSQRDSKSPQNEEAQYPEVDELARVRQTRRFDFEGGQRVFSPTGRFAALNSEMIRLWRAAEAACGCALTVWGLPPENLTPLPKEVPRHTFGAVWLRTERRFPGWDSMSTNEKRELVACLALLDEGIDPCEIFPPTSSS